MSPSLLHQIILVVWVAVALLTISSQQAIALHLRPASLPCYNKRPHVTIALVPGESGFYSNSLLETSMQEDVQVGWKTIEGEARLWRGILHILRDANHFDVGYLPRASGDHHAGSCASGAREGLCSGLKGGKKHALHSDQLCGRYIRQF